MSITLIEIKPPNSTHRESKYSVRTKGVNAKHQGYNTMNPHVNDSWVFKS